MKHALLKFAFVFTLLLLIGIGLIRAQPYDASQLRAILTPPDGCPMPCFMGIRPGVTTMEEALTILQAHEWVGKTEPSEVGMLGGSLQFLDWYWNGHQPALLTYPDEPRQSIRGEDGIVRFVLIWTNIGLGDARLLFGPPERATLDLIGSPSYMNLLTITGYQELGLMLNSYVPCPTSLENLWNTPIAITLASPSESTMSWTPANNMLSMVRYWNAIC